jgi:hypothetical protein
MKIDSDTRLLMLIDVLKIDPKSSAASAMNYAYSHTEQYGLKKFGPHHLVKWDENQFVLFLKAVMMGMDNEDLSENMEEELEDYNLL